MWIMWSELELRDAALEKGGAYIGGKISPSKGIKMKP